MDAIRITDVVKRYPEFTLGPINMSVGQGEFFGIFGPPSTGKTSVLKLILGLLTPDEGQVEIAGRDAAEMEVSARGISMVFQNLALFPHMTGRENIIFPLKERGASEAEIAERLDLVSEVLHVSHILHKNPAQMSGGERQRIALGRAFAAQSRAMLLDEPIAALDARLREEMRVELKRLQRENNQTFVYVSHDEEEVMAISDRVAVIVGGRIAQIGTPEEVYNEPCSLAVAEVIGSPPMNFFEGRFSAEGLRFESDVLETDIQVVCTTQKGGAGTLGVRPEDIWLGESEGNPSFKVRVSTVEPLGGYTIINARIGKQIIKIRAPGQVALEEDAWQSVSLDARRLHLFCAKGSRL
ncbi:ABC transporter ATP-binding protein [Ruegeria pomeroyi]|uniref:Sugar ABC transporter, ATP-binding protein n=2 Tax=Ruegeria pomeroyi TaxID=89184 RepID=Q5LLY2_RUEPO|nr:ABC transporter ATP-binding protein [Ruegeria pomeroyi]AAV97003.1 sugar ABC transporter, ATP-binding protein [Ruegeria pomeroyi DSS-3]NVK99169.1 ABC transporter ATP-binding protein [Ruegeria pomeroyi]NVL03689.1 ABC transporter ATP-binding protein [Ruegeria pomeroyi]QWV10531.1 ABC transporter ATP-binding protein [Ruegeria pomeroyi]